MALTKYEGPGEIYCNGRLLAECMNASATVRGNNTKVYTMIKGLSGKSDGPRESSISIESAIPRKGYEVKFVEKVVKGDYFTLVIKSGGQRHTFSVWAEEAAWKNGTQEAASFSVQCEGSAPESRG